MSKVNNKITVVSPSNEKEVIEEEKKRKTKKTKKSSLVQEIELQRGENFASFNFRKLRHANVEDFEQKGRFQCKNTLEINDEARQKKGKHRPQNIYGHQS